MADRLTHAPDLTVAPLVDGDAQPVRGHQGDASGRGPAVLQVDPVPQAAQGARFRRAIDDDQVLLFHSEAGMGEPVGEIPVIGEQQEPLAVGVEAADRIDAWFVRDQVGHHWPAIGIGGRADGAGRFVEQVVHQPGQDAHRDAVHGHPVGDRINPAAQGRHLPVDLHPARGDEVFACPPAADATLGQHLLEALTLGIGLSSGGHGPGCSRSPAGAVAPGQGGALTGGSELTGSGAKGSGAGSGRVGGGRLGVQMAGDRLVGRARRTGRRGGSPGTGSPTVDGLAGDGLAGDLAGSGPPASSPGSPAPSPGSSALSMSDGAPTPTR